MAFLLLAVSAGCSDTGDISNPGDVSYPSGTDAVFSIPFVKDIGYIPDDIVDDISGDTGLVDTSDDITIDVTDISIPDTTPVDVPSEEDSFADADALIEEDTQDGVSVPEVIETDVCANAAICDDGNPCTEDLCTGPGSCEYLPQENDCDDGNDCTENDGCADSKCVGDWVDCDDSNPCTNEACLPGTGCVYQNTDGYCGPDSDWICVDGECVISD